MNVLLLELAKFFAVIAALLGVTGIAMCVILVWRELRAWRAQRRDARRHRQPSAHPQFTRHRLHS